MQPERYNNINFLSLLAPDHLNQSGIGLNQVVLLALFSLLAFFGLWMSWAWAQSFLLRNYFAMRAQNLYLASQFYIANNMPDAKMTGCYVRELRMSSATFITPLALRRSDAIALALRILPDFPEPIRLEGRIASCRPLPQSPGSFIATLRFNSTAADGAQSRLASYIRCLRTQTCKSLDKPPV